MSNSNTTLIETLLPQPESATLEFKQEFHDIYSENSETRKRQLGELVKDVLSLANGSANTAGEQAYLVFGAGDAVSAEQPRVVIGVTKRLPDTKELLQKINPFCDPPLDKIRCEKIDYDGKTMFLITVSPTPRIYETTRDLSTPSAQYSKHTVFIRRHEMIDVASSRDRETLSELKRIKNAERFKVDPILFGVVVGTIIGSMVAFCNIKAQTTEAQNANARSTSIAGALVGGFLGGIIGNLHRSIILTNDTFIEIPRKHRPLFGALLVLSSVGATVIVWLILRLFRNILRKRQLERMTDRSL